FPSILPVLDNLRRQFRSSDDRAADADDGGRARPGPPSIGLALSGGAARGFAHIGVIRTLAAAGIKPDVITGTSIGAVIAGVHAAGQLDRFEAWARQLTRRRVFGYLDFSLSGTGLIGGDRLFSVLDAALDDLTFQDLPVRLAAVATELRTNHEIWLTRGRIADALRAPRALPGLFPPPPTGRRRVMGGAPGHPPPLSARPGARAP